MKTLDAVTELVQAGHRHFGGEGKTEARVIRGKKLERMKIYIAGKITGRDYDVAYFDFEVAEEHLRASGHEPLNPMKMVDQSEGRTYNEYLADAIKVALEADAFYMLGNWRDSKGARIEHAIAEVTGKEIFYEGSEVPVL